MRARPYVVATCLLAQVYVAKAQTCLTCDTLSSDATCPPGVSPNGFAGCCPSGAYGSYGGTPPCTACDSGYGSVNGSASCVALSSASNALYNNAWGECITKSTSNIQPSPVYGAVETTLGSCNIAAPMSFNPSVGLYSQWLLDVNDLTLTTVTGANCVSNQKILSLGGVGPGMSLMNTTIPNTYQIGVNCS